MVALTKGMVVLTIPNLKCKVYFNYAKVECVVIVLQVAFETWHVVGTRDICTKHEILVEFMRDHVNKTTRGN